MYIGILVCCTCIIHVMVLKYFQPCKHEPVKLHHLVKNRVLFPSLIYLHAEMARQCSKIKLSVRRTNLQL